MMRALTNLIEAIGLFQIDGNWPTGNDELGEGCNHQLNTFSGVGSAP